MRDTRFLWALGCIALLACGGTELSINDGGGGDGSNPNGNDGSTNPGMDGSVTPTDGGVVSNPGQIDCNGQTCQAGTNICCVRYVDGGLNTSCTGPQMCQGARLGCDEKADCMGNDVCCFGASMMSGIGTRCQAPQMGMNACGQFAVQVCKASQECGAMGTCAPHQCPNLGTVWTCTKPFGCN